MILIYHSWAYIQRIASQDIRETLAHQVYCIAALFTIAKLWNQPKCPSIDKWIENI
jgi:hypothetical protein